MITMLIADDEMLSRYSFRILLQKNFPEVTVVGEAENGKAAMEMACALQPDIVVMDIRMPVMSGLDATREILARYPSTAVLMLTAYNHFEYIKEGVDLGVKGYFLKPLNADEVCAKLSAVISSIQEQRHKTDTRERVERDLNTVRPIIARELVAAYMDNSGDNEKILRYQQLLQVPTGAGYFMLIALRDLGSAKINDAIRVRIFQEKALKITSEAMNLLHLGLLGSFVLNVLPVFVTVSPKANDRFARQECLMIAGEIAHRIETRVGVQVSVAVGGIYREISQYKLSYQEAASIIDTVPIGDIVLYSEFTPKASDFHYPYALEQALLDSLKSKELRQASLILEDIVRELFSSELSYSQLLEYTQQFIVAVRRGGNLMGIEVETDSGIQLQKLVYITNRTELQEYLLQGIHQIIGCVQRQNSHRNYALTKRIDKYLSENIFGDITLETLSTHLSLSPQYVSKLFKDEFGQTFINYVTVRRVEAAKELLVQDDVSIRQVAARVGYNDPNYFCRIFKKLTGATPKEYQIMH